MTTVLQSLNRALHAAMAESSRVLVVGEDILDPYGGAFKVTKGLSSAYPDRVVGTPISEAGMTGLAIGLALGGYRPVVEIMFGDFVTLCADQLINHASKIATMYGEPVPLPIVVRAPMGGRRGYGATHSQTLERLYLGLPGVSVVAASPVLDPGELLRRAVLEDDGPVLFVENKVMYAERVLDAETLRDRYGCGMRLAEGPFPAVTLTPEAPDVTVVTYGGMTSLVLQAAKRLAEEEELACEIVVEHRISPWDERAVFASVERTRRCVVVEEGVAEWGWGAEIAARLTAFGLESPVQRVGAARESIPVRKDLEERVLPQVDDIVAAVVRTVDEDPR